MRYAADSYVPARATPIESWRSARRQKTDCRLCHRCSAALGVCLTLLLACAPLPAQAGNFPPVIHLEHGTLARVGYGTAHYAGFIPVCDIALYSTPGPQTGHLLDPQVAKRLDIVYRVAIRAERLSRAAENILARQHPEQRLARWREQIDALHRSYTDVQPGDRYTLTYLPQQELRLEFNGERVLGLAGDGFAALYFGIWLGEEPLSEPLRLQLLSGTASDVPSAGTALTPP